MNRPENLERDLAIWFADTAAPSVPDFTDDILRLTAGTRQRPRWSFPERWLPMSVITLARQTFKPLPWRTIGILAVLALLIAAAVAVYVGSPPRLPAPFGLAANGQVAYATGGDIYTVDPVTGAREALVTGPDTDQEPRWSLDGTRIAFLRGVTLDRSLVIVDRRSRDVVATTEVLIDPDADSVAWSPDGRSILVASGPEESRALNVVDAATGVPTKLPIDFLGEASWRPPAGGQILYIGGTEADKVLSLVNLADYVVTPIARPVLAGGLIRPAGWTPDGRRVVYMAGDGIGDVVSTHIVDLTTQEMVTIAGARAPHVSNDGTRIVAINDSDRMCVASTRGGPCVVVGEPNQVYGPGNAAGVQWSPDDEWIITRNLDTGTAYLVDPDGGASRDQPPWIGEGGESWQRLAP